MWDLKKVSAIDRCPLHRGSYILVAKWHFKYFGYICPNLIRCLDCLTKHTGKKDEDIKNE